VGIQNRNLVKGALPRFRFPQGAECNIYNLPVLRLLKPGETLFITEGCSDCWAMLSAGHKAIAIPSATLLKRKDAEQLSSFLIPLSTKFAMYPDNDVPGERLYLQLKELLPSLVRYQLPMDCKDFSDYYVSIKKKETNHG
jgi:DNA primase